MWKNGYYKSSFNGFRVYFVQGNNFKAVDLPLVEFINEIDFYGTWTFGDYGEVTEEIKELTGKKMKLNDQKILKNGFYIKVKQTTMWNFPMVYPQQKPSARPTLFSRMTNYTCSSTGMAKTTPKF